MAKKIVGFYRTQAEMDRARDDLLKAGFDRNDLKTFSGSDQPGMWDDIKEFFGFADEEDRRLYHEAARRGSIALMVDLTDDDTPSESQAAQILQRHNPIDLQTEAGKWRAQGWTEREGVTTQPEQMAQTQKGEQVIPVTEEQMRVGKRAVQTGGVRVHTHIVEKPVEEQVQLREERIKVERRPADRPETEADKALRGKSVEIRVTAEEPVVSKEGRVVEEVVIGKETQQRTETVRGTVKRTEVNIEQIGQPGETGFPERYASIFATDERLRGREWKDVEPEAKRAFEERYPGKRWEMYREDIYRGYESKRPHA